MYTTSTFSIVAYDAAAGRIGVATASCVLAVGGRGLYHKSDACIVRMQHIEEPRIGEQILAEIASGRHPQEAIEEAIEADAEAQQRQVLAADFAGRFGVYNGGGCMEVCAHAASEAAVAAGNCLSAATVPQAMLEAYAAAVGESLSMRLIRALARAAELKGDKRGLQSAAIVSIPRRLDSWKSQIVDLRADFHEDPVGELARLYGVFRGRFGPQ